MAHVNTIAQSHSVANFCERLPEAVATRKVAKGAQQVLAGAMPSTSQPPMARRRHTSVRGATSLVLHSVSATLGGALHLHALR